MNLTEFAKSRNQKTQTISIYINRHKEDFENHITKKGKTLKLDETAIELLDKQYPQPKPVQVVQGIPQEEHEALQKKYINLLEIDSRKDEMIRQLMQEKTDLQLQMKDLQLLEMKVQEFDKKSWFEKMKYKFQK